MNSPTDRSSNPRSPLPFSVQIDVLDRMLNLEIADDPLYRGLEVQGFDDPRHGRGIAVLLSHRADDTTDVYYQSGLQLDPSSYAIGGGLGAWVETEFETARLTITPNAVDAAIRFTDTEGRPIEVRIGDRTRGRRRTSRFLAPMGAAITKPRSLPLVWMSRFDLLRRTGPEPLIRIDGRAAQLGRLPAEKLFRRRLIKIASELCVVSINPTEIQPVHLTTSETTDGTDVGPEGVQAISAREGKHAVVVRLDPPFPDLSRPASGATTAGAWDLLIDDTPLIAGTWQTAPRGDAIEVGFDVTQGWRPQGLPLLMRVVTRVAPVFRRWPTTYKWTAIITPGDPPAMTSRWERTGTERGDSYRSLTGTE